MEVNLDKLIATWESIVVSDKVSRNMEAIILMTLQELNELKRIRKEANG